MNDKENKLDWTDMLLAPPSVTRDFVVETDMDWWVCKCGNEPHFDVYSSCSEMGERCEPEEGVWDGKHWLCEKCYRIIDGDTLEILGSCSDDVANKNEEYRWHEESL